MFEDADTSDSVDDKICVIENFQLLKLLISAEGRSIFVDVNTSDSIDDNICVIKNFHFFVCLDRQLRW